MTILIESVQVHVLQIFSTPFSSALFQYNQFDILIESVQSVCQQMFDIVVPCKLSAERICTRINRKNYLSLNDFAASLKMGRNLRTRLQQQIVKSDLQNKDNISVKEQNLDKTFYLSYFPYLKGKF